MVRMAEAKAIFTRRALILTSAPSFNSLSRIVPQVALASVVWARAQGADENVGHRGEPQPQLICAHQGG